MGISGTTAFFGPAKRGKCFFARAWVHRPQGILAIRSSHWKNFSEILLLSFATKLEMIFIF
jgi:hypothetical protein